MATLDLSRPAANPQTAQTGARPWAPTIEQAAYLGLGLIALFAHLWMLGDRALHHDETLHASYSWFLFVGRGYIHDPLLHGPLLYHLGALSYFLFGDNDFTARLSAALAGTALTLTPYLIRREIGRPAALIAAGYLLISPVTLYVGRFFRHDIYSVLCEALVFAAIVRYASTRNPRWLLVGAAAFGLMSVNQETSYLYTLIMGVPLIATFLWRIYKPGLAMVAALGLLLIALVFILPAHAQVDGAHHAIRDPQTGAMLIDPERPGFFGWPPLATEDNEYALRIRNRSDDDGGRSLLENLGVYLGDLWQFFGHPAIMLGMGLSLATVGALYHLIWRRPEAGGLTPWQAARARGDATAAVFASLAQGRRWLVALLIFLSIYALFFTAFFSNLLGLITGTTGSLLYWLAQHNVQRGSQPGHYYLIQLIIYEPLLLLFGAVALGLIGRGLVKNWRSGHLLLQTAHFSILLLAWWSIAAFAIYTWAGEKMPWLTIHLTLPLTLLAAWGFQQSLAAIWPGWGEGKRGRGEEGESGRDAPLQTTPGEGVVAAYSGESSLAASTDGMPLPPQPPDQTQGTVPPEPIPGSAITVYALLFSAIMGLAFVLVTAVVGFGDAAVIPLWLIPAGALVLLGLLTTAAGLRWGAPQALAMLALCIAVATSIYTIRGSYRLSFQNGDTPREMMVYTQTSPDVMRVIRRLEEASRRRGGDLGMPVIYDNETVWSWYLRDFPNAVRSGEQLGTPPDPSVMAVLMLQENLDRYPENRQLLEGFVIQRYPLRWWFPEDQVYRLNEGWRDLPLENASLLGQVLREPLNPAVGRRLWRFLIFRDLDASLGSSDFVVAVRPELAGQIGIGLGGNIESPDNR